MGPKMMPIGELCDGDCFFYMDEDVADERETVIHRLISEGLLPKMTGVEMRDMALSSASSFIVYAIVKRTGERCTTRLSDGRRHIWNNPHTLVKWTPDRASFLARVEAMKKQQKEIESAQAKSQRARSKKKNAPTEIEERTIVAGR